MIFEIQAALRNLIVWAIASYQILADLISKKLEVSQT